MDTGGGKLAFSAPGHEFQHMTEAEVQAGLRDEESDISLEMRRLVLEYFKVYRAYASLHSDVLARIRQIQSCCPMQRLALLTMIVVVQEELGGIHTTTVH